MRRSLDRRGPAAASARSPPAASLPEHPRLPDHTSTAAGPEPLIGARCSRAGNHISAQGGECAPAGKIPVAPILGIPSNWSGTPGRLRRAAFGAGVQLAGREHRARRPQRRDARHQHDLLVHAARHQAVEDDHDHGAISQGSPIQHYELWCDGSADRYDLRPGDCARRGQHEPV